MLAFSTQVRGFKPGRSRRIFRAKKSSAEILNMRIIREKLNSGQKEVTLSNVGKFV